MVTVWTTQEVISALRGTGQEVTLLLCRPQHGVLPDMDSTLVSPDLCGYAAVVAGI